MVVQSFSGSGACVANGLRVAERLHAAAECRAALDAVVDMLACPRQARCR
jgi:hypothetical protein